MANLVSVKKMPRRNDMAESQLNSSQGIITIRGQEFWQVVYDGPIDQFSVRSAAGLPKVGDMANTLMTSGTTNTTTLVVQRVQPVRHSDNYCVWEVQIDIEDTRQPFGPFNIQFERSHQTFEQQCWTDRLDKPLCNTLNDLLPQLPTDTLADETISIRYSLCTGSNSATADVPNIAAIDGAMQKTNSDTGSIRICGRSYSFTNTSMIKLLAAPIRSSRQVIGAADTNGTSVYQFMHEVELQLLIRRDRFIWNAPNEGYRGYPLASNVANYPGVANTNTVVTFVDANQLQRTLPTRLDTNSVEIALSVSGTGAVKMLPANLPDGGTNAGRFELSKQAAFFGSNGLFTWGAGTNAMSLNDP